MHRRDILLQGALLPIIAALAGGARAQEAMPFDNATVRNLARHLAQHAVAGAGRLAARRVEEP